MGKTLKIIVVMLISFSIFGISKVSASFDEVIMSYPLEAELTTSQYSYKTNEVVSWKVNIAGGSTTGPNFDVHFFDSEGNSYWINDLNTYTTTINLDYQEIGKVTGNITVYSSNQVVSDSWVITIK